MGDSLVWKYNAEPSIEDLVAQFQAPLIVMIGPLLKIAHSPEILSLLPNQRPPYRIVDPKVVERGINMTALWNTPWTAALAPGANTAGIDIQPADSRYKHTAPAQSQREREVQHTVSQHNAAALIQGRTTEEEDQPEHLHDNSAAPTQAQTDGVDQRPVLHHNTTTLTQAQTKDAVSSRKRKASFGEETEDCESNILAFKNGNVRISLEIRQLVESVRRLRRNKDDLPMRIELRNNKDMHGHFGKSAGCLMASSPLAAWYGDTRLFSEKWWKHLHGGKGTLPR